MQAEPAPSTWIQLVMSCKALTQKTFSQMAAKLQQCDTYDSNQVASASKLLPETQVSDEEKAAFDVRVAKRC